MVTCLDLGLLNLKFMMKVFVSLLSFEVTINQLN